ncbi:hypothetical protein FH608_038725 [Nonomuraea phyllanthi]|uniref:Uncharacterized protein n=1 Tax=Nonomuraea phyllanthi TaxID=2219224 RepID=A0A5C4VMX7_9ACTN|nr:hypothetical protein [Nonomuraea phyllanthi]KAB8189536.1 hypothetical protein FH608_038725 [Nonomuraea phyllanthi]
MTNRAWFNTDQHLLPGKEIFRSERRFALWAYTVTHGQALFRSLGSTDCSGGRPETTIEVLFKPAAIMKIRDCYHGLLIRNAPADEAERIRALYPSVDFSPSDRVFLLESQGETDYVISMAVGWHEDILSPTRRSFFANVSAGDVRWPPTPLSGADAGFTIAPAADLIGALRSSEGHQRVRREEYRDVYVVMTRVEFRDGPDISGSGVFLTHEDAEEAIAVLAPHVADCWIETLPIAI